MGFIHIGDWNAEEPPLTSTSALMETQQRPACPRKRLSNVYQDIPGDSRTKAGGWCLLAFTQLAPQPGGSRSSLPMVLARSPSWKTFCRVDGPRLSNHLHTFVARQQLSQTMALFSGDASGST